MSYFKMIGLAAVTAASLLVFVGSASATTVTSPQGTSYTGLLKGESSGHAVLDNPIAKIECTVRIEGQIENHGPGVTAKGQGSGFIVGGCTEGWHVTTVSSGTVEAHFSGGNGIITSSGATVEATRFGITCRYATSGTQVGVATPGSPATLHIAAAIPFHSGSIFCGTGATTGTGSGVATTPTSLYLDE